MVQFFSKSTAHGIRLARSDCGQSIRLPCLCFGGRGGTPECLQVQAFVHSCSTGSKTNFACVRISSAVCAYILRSYAPNVYELRAVFFFRLHSPLTVKFMDTFRWPRLCTLLAPDGGRALMYHSRPAGVEIRQLPKAAS